MLRKILILLPIIFLLSCKKEVQIIPQAKKGILDLRSWNFAAKGNVSLNGEWDFYWKKFVKPDSLPNHEGYIDISKYWNKQLYRAGKLPAFGYATYHLKIILPDSVQNLGLYFKEVQCAYDCYLNGEKLYSAGIPGTSAKTEIPDYNYDFVPIPSSGNTLDLIFYLSNFHHRNSGFYKAPEIGFVKAIIHERFLDTLLDIFLFSILIVLSFYHIAVYWRRKEVGAFLWFSIFSLILAIRVLFSGVELFKYIFPETPWEITYRIKYATLYLLVFSFTKYIHELRYKTLNKTIIRIFELISLCMLLLLFLPAYLYTYSLDFIGFLIILGFLYLSYDILKHREDNILESGILFISIFVILIASLNDVLVAQKIYNGVILLPFANFIFLIGQADILLRLINKSFNETNKLKDELAYQNQHLEELIDKRELTIKKNYKNIINVNEKLQEQQKTIKNQLIKIKSSEENYRNTLNFMPQILVECDKNGEILFANLKFFEQTGLKQEKLPKDINIFDFMQLEDAEFIKKELEIHHIIQGKRISITALSGNKLQFAVFISVLHIENIYSGFRGIFIDVSKQEKLEKQLEVLERSINQSNTGIILANSIGNLEYFNQQILTFFNKTHGQIQTELKNIFETPLIDSIVKDKLKEAIVKKEKQKLQFSFNNENNRKIWVQLLISLVIEDNKVAHLLVILNDITKEKELELSQSSISKQLRNKNQEIIQSIEYAKFIQKAILTSNENFTHQFNTNFFIINKPLHIVSGDFYFMKCSTERIILVLGDSTGHGVPGAFISMLGITLLTDIIDTFPTISAADTLELMRLKIINTLSRGGNKIKLRDSIDMAICIFNLKTRELNYSGANRPIILAENGEVRRVKPIKQSLGSNHVNIEFENNYANLAKGSRLYLYSDGITDQFGGLNDKKYGTKRFTNFIQDIQASEMIRQKDNLDKEFLNWKGKNKQIDDILIMGFEF